MGGGVPVPMTLDRVIMLVGVLTGYVGCGAFTIMAFRWTRIIRDYAALDERYVAAMAQSSLRNVPLFSRQQRRIAYGLQDSRHKRQHAILMAVVLFIYGTGMLTIMGWA